ncbi:MAG TPA: lactoylglutathione lyase [Bacteroidia bacterium]|nr:lactoylglutathione lyase [Bacteroidia bacterium]HNS12355.1 lactoylglutathione lyase [Bacteroidia bacterium]
MVLIILYVADQQRSKHFYSQVLQSSPIVDVPGMTEFILGENCKLGLMPEAGIAKIISPPAPHPASGNGIPRNELYLYVDLIEPYAQRSLAAGAKLISPEAFRDWGEHVAYFMDPDGHIIAFSKKN